MTPVNRENGNIKNSVFLLDKFSSVDKITCRFLEMIFPDKAKPSARRGRKATGLIKSRMAELPKDDPWGGSAFLFSREAFLKNRKNNLRQPLII